MLTPEKEALWRKWVSIYKQHMLPKGEYLGSLYDIGFDRPEAHAISRDGAMYYAFYARRSSNGKLQLRGLGAGKYRVRDLFNETDLGTVDAQANTVNARFERFPADAARADQTGMTHDANRNWVVYALVTVALWGVWGALAGLLRAARLPGHAGVLRVVADHDSAGAVRAGAERLEAGSSRPRPSATA